MNENVEDEEEDVTYAVCSPLTDTPVPGSSQRPCQVDECGAMCWVSPSTTEGVDAGRYRVACLDCAAKHVAENPDDGIDVPEHVLADMRALGWSDEFTRAVSQAWYESMRKTP